MKFFRIANRLRNLRRAEDGAVTVDWVVLTAAVVGLGAAALMLIRTNTLGAATTIGSYLSGDAVKDLTSEGGED
ncbi:hypothetical protein D2T31_10315 [Sinirhodobacter populi]|uniref:Pilus assembly protein n=1 Tax=Paenirhodobacter populi TaxID=2306993 RepID=A0A443K9A1_9RHOB|nr:hypothetical protein [Sinirhodobacter populi]RWR29377.1 hypothetical protein D2T31_10315 [Sinirhodobacter populi]